MAALYGHGVGHHSQHSTYCNSYVPRGWNIIWPHGLMTGGQQSRYSSGNNFHSTSLLEALFVPRPHYQTALRLNSLMWAKTCASLRHATPASYNQRPRLFLPSLPLPSPALAWLEVPALTGTTPLLPAPHSWSAMVPLEGAYAGADHEPRPSRASVLAQNEEAAGCGCLSLNAVPRWGFAVLSFCLKKVSTAEW